MRLLDLFCGAGGAAMGYSRAGFDVVGVDITPQPRYPFRFIQADAMTFPLEGFDCYHASPPCQGYTTMNNRWGSRAPLLIAETRDRLRATGQPWILENVPGALRWMETATELTGEMFALGVHRPRLFDTSFVLLTPPRPPRQRDAAAVYGKCDQRRLFTRVDGSSLHASSFPRAAAAMGIDWMTWDELREAIPPAYTEYIGHQVRAYVAAA